MAVNLGSGIRLGSGSYTYELVGGWGQLPYGKAYGWGVGVVVDSQDNVYLHTKSPNAVVVFDREGKFLRSWGEDFAEGAHGLYLSKEDSTEYLYLADHARHLVVKTTLDGKVIFTVGVPELPDVYKSHDLYKPTDVAVAPNGDFYVCDGYGQSWIHQYNSNGIRIRSWGGKGSEPGKMNSPHGIWIDTRKSEPFVYVADRANNRIQVFTLDGQHVRFINDGGDLLRYPCCFYQFQGNMYIPDLYSRVTIIDEDDKLITHLGDDPEAYKKPNWPRRPMEERSLDKFIAPHACCVDSHGDLYVIEWVSDARLRKYARVG